MFRFRFHSKMLPLRILSDEEGNMIQFEAITLMLFIYAIYAIYICILYMLSYLFVYCHYFVKMYLFF